MAKKDSFRQEDMNNLVPVIFAKDMEEAEIYRDLLEDYEITATIANEEFLERLDPDTRSEYTHGVAVLVPEVMLEEAGEVVAQREESSLILEDFDEIEDDEEDEDYDSESMTNLDDLSDLDEDDEEEEDSDGQDDESHTDLEAFKEAFGEDLLEDEILDEDEDDEDFDDEDEDF